MFRRKAGETDFSLCVDLPCLPRVGDVVLINGQLGWGKRKSPEESLAGAAYGYSPEKGEYGMYRDDTPGTGTCVVRSVNWIISYDVPSEIVLGVDPTAKLLKKEESYPVPVVKPGSEPTLTRLFVELEMANGPYNSEGFKVQLERCRQRGKTVKEVD